MKHGRGLSLLLFVFIILGMSVAEIHAATIKAPVTDDPLELRAVPNTAIRPTSPVTTIPTKTLQEPETPSTPQHNLTVTQPAKPVMTPTLQKPVLTVPDPYCFNDLYGDMKATFNNVTQLCTQMPNPPVQTYLGYRERMKYNFFNWNLSKCPSLVPENVNKDVHDIHFQKIPQAATQCGDKCFTVVNDLLVAGSFSAALSQCESCCGFSLEQDQAQCRVECNQAIDVDALLAEQAIDAAKSGADGAKEAFKEALELLNELSERQSDNAQTMTNP